MIREQFKIEGDSRNFGTTLIPSNRYSYPLLRRLIGNRPLKYPANSLAQVVSFLKAEATGQGMRFSIRPMTDPIVAEIETREPSDYRREKIPGAINEITELASALGVPIPAGYSETNEANAEDLLARITNKHVIEKSTRIKFILPRMPDGRPMRTYTPEDPDDLPGPFSGISFFGDFGPNLDAGLHRHALGFPFDLSSFRDELLTVKSEITHYRVRHFGCATCLRMRNAADGGRWRRWSCPTLETCPACHGQGILPD